MEPDRQEPAILVVDDNPDVRMLVEVLLRNAGYTVYAAADGEEGVSFYKRHRSRIALLLTDMKMPNMNGIDLANRVLEFDSQLPILFMSGDSEYVSRGYQCLKKPFTSDQLVGRVNQALACR